MTVAQHRRVLIVDDDPEIRGILVTALQQKSLIADTAADGREAMALLSEQPYAVVLLDLLMPGVNGFRVLEAIDQGQVPIVMVLTGADRETVAKLDARKIHGIIRKPFDPEEIASVVAACIEIRGRSTLEAMAMTMVAGAPFMAWLKL
jgi:two-component system OmpR family response regulator